MSRTGAIHYATVDADGVPVCPDRFVSVGDAVTIVGDGVTFEVDGFVWDGDACIARGRCDAGDGYRPIAFAHCPNATRDTVIT